MLAHFLVDYCEIVGAREPDRELVIYFFCGTQDGLNSGPSLLRGLVYQILVRNQAKFCHIKEAFSNHGKSLFDDARFEALWRVFDSMIKDKTLKSVTCILDGLDECIEESLAPFLVKIRDVFTPTTRQRSKTPSSIFKAIAISRNFPESFEVFLDRFPRLRIDVSHNVQIGKDVSKYIDDGMKLLACAEHKKPKLGQLRLNVRKKLVDGADGSYLWVKFAIKSLEGVTCPELEEAITEFPRGLDDIYARMLHALPGRQKSKVIQIIRWVATAYRPLTLLEIGTALELPRADDQDLGDATADFVKCARDLLLISESKNVVLVHASFQDFLVQFGNDSVPGYTLQPSVSHWILASRTYEYTDALINLNPQIKCWPSDGQNINEDLQRHPLLEYSSRYGLQHLSETTIKESESFRHPLLNDDWSARQGWMRTQRTANSRHRQSYDNDLIHLAALLGRIELVRYCIVHRGMDVNMRDVRQRTPIFYAITSGRVEVVKYLLVNGANPNLLDSVGQRPIHIACGYGDMSIVDLLLTATASPNALTVKTTFTSDIHGLLHEGTFGQRSDDWNRADATPLHFAVEYGHTHLVDLLLQHGADLSLKDQLARTALHYARVQTEKHCKAAELLNKAGIDMFVSDLEGNTAFHRMVQSIAVVDLDDTKILATMLDRGFPVDTPTQPSLTGRSGGTIALQLACELATSCVVAFLMDRGANPNLRDDNGQTTLHYVAKRDLCLPEASGEASEISQLLLLKMSGAVIVAQDIDGRSALDLALEADEEKQKQLERLDNMAFPVGFINATKAFADFDEYERLRKNKERVLDRIDSALRCIKSVDMVPDEEEEFIEYLRQIEDDELLARSLLVYRWRREIREVTGDQAPS